MKTTSFAAAAILASAAAAQPHGHHHAHAKREYVTEWEYVTETVSVLIDESTTQTVYPPKPATTELPETTSIAPVVQTTVDSQTTVDAQTTFDSPTPTVEVPASTPTTLVTSTSSPPPPPPPPATTEVAVAPTTTTPQALSVKSETSPAVAAAAATIGAGLGLDVKIPFGVQKTGDLTYFDIGIGACGYEDSGKGESENIVAVSVKLWNSISSLTNAGIDQPLHPLCFQTITLTNEETGTTATAKIHDSCPECALDDIDGSPHLFKDLFGSTEAGRKKISWSINQN
ncbi:hypothetical protein F5X99DRAFT_201692 [Biscogniauxia marginata]|nr:hypothetical protein F5X99DRAFT_201692 [Biscogniauxia marginata]